MRDAVDGRQHLGEYERVAVRHDEDARTDADPRRASADRGHDGERVVDELLGHERRRAAVVVEVPRRHARRHDHVVVHPDRVVAESLCLLGDRQTPVDAGVLAESSRSCR